MAGLISVDLMLGGARAAAIKTWLHMSFAVYTPVQNMPVEYKNDPERDPGARVGFSITWGDTLHIKVNPKGVGRWVLTFTYEESGGWTHEHWVVFIFYMFKYGVPDDDIVWIRGARNKGHRTFEDLLTPGGLPATVHTVQAKRDIDRVYARLTWVDTLKFG